MTWDTNRKRTPRVEFRQGYGARGTGDGSGQQPTLQALRGQSGLQAVADGHRGPAGLLRLSAALGSAGGPPRTLRGCSSFPLGTTAAGYFTLSNIRERYRTTGDSQTG